MKSTLPAETRAPAACAAPGQRCSSSCLCCRPASRRWPSAGQSSEARDEDEIMYSPYSSLRRRHHLVRSGSDDLRRISRLLCGDSNGGTMRRVVASGVSSHKSLLSPWHRVRRVWTLKLECGHETWRRIRSVKPPRRVKCAVCGAIAMGGG